MPHTSNWQTRGARIVAKMPPEEKYRTCCNCCHIKTGTVFLGLIELLAVSIILSGIIQQLMWKHDDVAFCRKKWAVFMNIYGMWRDCLIFEFSHFNVTLAGDYIIALIMIAIIISIIFMFFGIMSISPSLLVPHLVVQAIGLIASFGYFFLYAWSYFYGDLHTQKKQFDMRSFAERMWLASILLIFSMFQCYLFLTVIKCSLYLNSLYNEQKRRASQFEEVSARVRKAKENGLWKNTSWGGTFQEYRGQYDEKQKKLQEKKNKPVKGVQWDLQKNTEKSISAGLESVSTDDDKTQPPETPPAKVSKQPPMTLMTVAETKPTTSSAKPMPHIPIRRASIELQVHRQARDSPKDAGHKQPRPLSPTKQNSSSNESNKLPGIPEGAPLKPASTVTVQHAKDVGGSNLKQVHGHLLQADSSSKKKGQLTRQKSLDSSPPRAKTDHRPKTMDFHQHPTTSSTKPASSRHHITSDMSPKRKKTTSANGHGAHEKESPKTAQARHHTNSGGSPKQPKKGVAGEAYEMTSSKLGGQHHRVKDDPMTRSKRKTEVTAKR